MNEFPRKPFVMTKPQYGLAAELICPACRAEKKDSQLLEHKATDTWLNGTIKLWVYCSCPTCGNIYLLRETTLEKGAA